MWSAFVLMGASFFVNYLIEFVRGFSPDIDVHSIPNKGVGWVLSAAFFLDAIFSGIALQRMGDVSVRVGIKVGGAAAAAAAACGGGGLLGRQPWPRQRWPGQLQGAGTAPGGRQEAGAEPQQGGHCSQRSFDPAADPRPSPPPSGLTPAGSSCCVMPAAGDHTGGYGTSRQQWAVCRG